MRSPRTITWNCRLPISTVVGWPETSESNLAVVDSLPTILACASGRSLMVTSLPASSNSPACAGPLGKTSAFPASVPKLFAPGLSQYKPTSGSQFCFRSPTCSAFHFSKDCTYAASGAAIDDDAPFPAPAESRSNETHAVKNAERFIGFLMNYLVFVCGLCRLETLNHRGHRGTQGSSSLVFAWIGKGLKASAGKYFFEFVQQCFVYQSIRGERLAAVEFKWRTVKAAHLPARFLDDEHACRCVPGIQIEFPEAIETPRRHATQVERSRSSPPHSVSSQRNLMVEINIRILMALVAGKAGGHKALVQLRYLRNVDLLAVELRASSLLRGKQFAARGIIDNAGDADTLSVRKPLLKS